VADALLYVTLRWAMMLEMKVPGNTDAYMKRIEARPAVHQALKEEGLA
jgi:glutathione S-transferase